MKKRLPPLNWLRSFEASARHLNFTLAANELNLTQAAISQQIKGLESQLGVTLFKRLPRGLELTEAGMAYMPAVHEAVERLAAATDELFGEGRTRLLTVRVNLVFFTTWLAPRLARFRQLHPGIGLHFSSNIWLADQDKEADIDIRYGKGSWRGYLAHRLTWDDLFPVCSPGLLANDSNAELEDVLTRHDLLHVIGYEEGWGFWLKQIGMPRVDPSRGLQFDTLITALEMAALGHGFALGRTSLVAEMLASGRLVAPFEQRVPTDEAFYVVTPEHQYATPQAKAFLAWLLEEAEGARNAAGQLASES
ncbi:transcriptional regulator GcvA [Metapseudomonas boanensis]